MYSTLTRKTPLKAKTCLRAKAPLKARTPLRQSKPGTQQKKSARARSVNKSKAFSIFTDDLYRCHITGSSTGVHIHHIFGASNKTNSERYGFLVPLRFDWHDMADYGIHFNRELDLKYKRACQEYWLTHYGTKEEFIKVFGMWW